MGIEFETEHRKNRYPESYLKAKTQKEQEFYDRVLEKKESEIIFLCCKCRKKFNESYLFTISHKYKSGFLYTEHICKDCYGEFRKWIK
jgi:hypothetical protein